MQTASRAGYRPYNPYEDPYFLMYLQQQQAAEQKKKQGGGTGGTAAGGVGGGSMAAVLGQQYLKYRGKGGSSAQSPAPSAGNSTPSAPTVTSAGRVVDAPQGVSASRMTPLQSTTMPDGSAGTLMSDGTRIGSNGTVVNPDGTTVATDGHGTTVVKDSSGNTMTGARALGAAQAALGAYQIYQTYNDKNLNEQQKIAGYGSAGVNVYNGASQAAGGKGLGPWGAVASGAFNTYGTMNNGALDSKQKATRAQQNVGLAFGDYWTYGGASAAEGMLRKNKTTGKWLGKVDKLDQRTNPVTMALSHFMHGKSTRYLEADKTKELLAASNDPEYQRYVQAIRAQYNAPPPDKKHPFHNGQYGSWDEYQKAGLDANDLTGVYGNLKAFGVRWTKLTPDQQKAVTQGLIDAKQYYSDKGDVLIRDDATAQQIFDKATKGAPMMANKPPARNLGPAPVNQTQMDALTAAKNGMIPRQRPPANGAAVPWGGGAEAPAYNQPHNTFTRSPAPQPSSPQGPRTMGRLPARNIDPGFQMTPEEAAQVEAMLAANSRVPSRNTAPAPVTSDWRAALRAPFDTPMIPALAQRSKTRSPGIDMNGNRINYGSR